MNGTRQQIQYSLALEQADQGEAPVSGHQRTEPFVAKPAPESSAVTEQLMEEVCNRENLVRAWKRVRQNKGGPGVDGMTIDDAKDYLREHWPSIRSQLLAGTYQPQPVKRVEIPKPDGGVRKLGVPCVVDRLIQQALLQVLQGQWDPTFSEHSYGFRPGHSVSQGSRLFGGIFRHAVSDARGDHGSRRRPSFGERASIGRGDVGVSAAAPLPLDGPNQRRVSWLRHGSCRPAWLRRPPMLWQTCNGRPPLQRRQRIAGKEKAVVCRSSSPRARD